MSDINVILAEYKGLGVVRMCGNNHVHLNIGPTTINMHPEAFMQAAALVKQAMDTLSLMRAEATVQPSSSGRPN